MAGKLLLQKFQHDEPSWRKELSEEKQQKWFEWMQGLYQLEDLCVARWYGFPAETVVTLHVFSDASDEGYGAVAYFATSGHPTAFVAGKSKVINPKKRPTTPRSELQGLLISTRLAGTILQEVSEVMKIGNVVVWVDSMVVYHWV